MPTGQVTGLASGINWQETIQLIMQIESQPKAALETRKQVYQEKLSAWQQLNTKLLGLKTAMEGMNQLNEVLTKAATSSEQDILTASANSTAATGSYSVLVNQLALNDKVTHAGFANANTTPVTDSNATFTYTYAGEEYTVNVPAGATLTDLVQAINSDVDNEEVTASILNEGVGPTPYHLVLSGKTGIENTITNISHTLTNFAGAFENTQNAQNAQIRVDGYPPTSWIESEDNAVDGVIEGLTLHLHSADPATTATVSVSNDTSAAKTKIQDFIAKYNEVITLINSNTAYNAETETSGQLFGDASVIGIKGSLQSIIASVIPGLQDNAVYNSLSEIGVKSGAGGMLSINSTKLDEALDENFDDVGELFAQTTSSTNNNLTYLTSTTSTQGGVYNVVANYDDSGNLLSATINGNAAQIQGNATNGFYIVGMDGNPEAGLRIKFTYPGGGAGSTSAEVRFGTGSAVQIANKISFLTDPMDGTVRFAQEGIQDTLESINDQIDNWEARLAIKQKQLERKFLAMETLISQLQGQGNYVSAMISKM